MKSGFFITFSGNCREALEFYQKCFGGRLQIQAFDISIERPVVVLGSLVSENITIHGSDLRHDEGRIAGNHLAVFMHCENVDERKALMENLVSGSSISEDKDLKLIEFVDSFDVRWVLAV
ncbi:MAG TPA: hypothetical protein VF581_06955 [Flavobacterium sp.]|jgi:uncharacterized glyoxalase superfamily protein PhnB